MQRFTEHFCRKEFHQEPPPQKPERDGYGARVIGFVPSREQAGSVVMEYPPEGYVCRIAFTLPATPRVKTLEAE